MNKRGFTLIEIMIALSLLGILSITILPMLQGSFSIFNKNDIVFEMMNRAEMTMERLKAYDEDGSDDFQIYDMKVAEIIDHFSDKKEASISLPQLDKDEDYIIQISKEERAANLWEISVLVSYKKGEKYDDMLYKALIPKKQRIYPY